MSRKWRRDNQTWEYALHSRCLILMGLDLQWHWLSSTLPMFWRQKTLHLQFRARQCDFQGAQMVFLKLLVFSHASCVCEVQNPPLLAEEAQVCSGQSRHCVHAAGLDSGGRSGWRGELQDMPSTEQTRSASPQGEQERKYRLSDNARLQSTLVTVLQLVT